MTRLIEIDYEPGRINDEPAAGGLSGAAPPVSKLVPVDYEPEPLEAPPGPPKSVVLPSIKRVGGQFVESVGQTIEDITGENAVTRGLQDFGHGVVEANPSQINSIGDILENPWTTIKEAVAEQVPQLGAVLAGGRTGAALGGAVGSVVPGIGTGVGAAGGALIGGLWPIFVQEYGEIRGNQKETGEENIPLAIGGATAATALERFGLEKFALKAGAKGLGEALDVIPDGASRLAHAGQQALKTALIEGPGTEIPQTAIERYAGGQDIGTVDAFDEYALAGAKGAIGGGVIGGGLGLIAPREQAPSLQPSPARGEGEELVDERTLTPGAAVPAGVEEDTTEDGWGDGLTVEQRRHMASIGAEPGGGPPLPPAPLSSGPLGRAAAAGGITEVAPGPTMQPAQPSESSDQPAAAIPAIPAIPATEGRKRGPLSPLGTELAEQGKAEVAAEQTRLAGISEISDTLAQPTATPQHPPADTTGSIKTGPDPALRFQKLNTARTEANARKYAEGLAGRFPEHTFEVVPHRLTKGKFAVKAGPRVSALDQAAHEAATSPQNQKPEPTEGQTEAGNYPKGHTRLHGLDISIENPIGSTRRSKPGQPPWEVEMSAHYGYIRGTVGKDKEHIDTYIGPNPEVDDVYVVDQHDPKTGKFDEHKVMLGYTSPLEAEQAYDAHFSDGSGPRRRKNMVGLAVEDFKHWLKEGNTKEGIAGQAGVQAAPPAATIDDPQLAALPEEGGIDAQGETELQPSPQLDQRQESSVQAADSGGAGVTEPAAELPDSDNAGLLPADKADTDAQQALTGAESAPGAPAATPGPTPEIPPTPSLDQGEIASPGASPSVDSSPPGAQTSKTPETPADAGVSVSGGDEPTAPKLPRGTVSGGADEIGAVFDAVANEKPSLAKRAVRFAAVDEARAASIKEKAGVDVAGYHHSIDNFAIRHALKEHGDPAKESSRGQEAITREDFLRVPEIVETYDTLESAGQDAKGAPLIRYTKRYNGQTYYVEEVRTKRKELAFKTLWKTRTTKLDAAPEAPPALTSETVGRNPSQGEGSVTEPDLKAETTKADQPNREAERRFFALGADSAKLRELALAGNLAEFTQAAKDELQAMQADLASMGTAEEGRALLAVDLDKLPDTFYRSLYKQARRLGIEANRDPEIYKTALAKAAGDSNVTDYPPNLAAFTAGWDHAIAGKTKSTLPQDLQAVRIEGYGAARKWLKTPEGRVFYTGKLATKKLQNTGADLRRHWESRRQTLGQASSADIDAAVKAIEDATGRADLFKPAIAFDASPGLVRYVEKVRSLLYPFMEWLIRDNGPVHYHGRRSGQGPKERLRKYLVPQGHDAGEADRRLDEVKSDAQRYIDALSGLAQVLEGKKTVREGWTAMREYLSYPKEADEHRATKTDAWDKLLTFMRKPAELAYLVLESDAHFTKGHPFEYREGIADPAVTKATPLNRPKLDKITRYGLTDWRKGKNVTPTEFKKMFGFADVGFGKWVGGKQDQDHLNYAYDAFRDLAEFIGMEPTGIGLGGTLHFTIGALGHGRHSAHYQQYHPHPDGGSVPVINITNTRGDGSISHEWMHALDYHLQDAIEASEHGIKIVEHPDGKGFALKRTDGSYVVQEAWQKTPGAVKDWETRELAEVGQRHYDTGPRVGKAALTSIRLILKKSYDIERARNALPSFFSGSSRFQRLKKSGPVANAQQGVRYYGLGQDTDYLKQSNALGKDYWGNDAELFARAGEAWVFDKIAGRNDYLVSDWVEEGKVKKPPYRGTPYPTGDERSTFADAYRALFDSLDWKDDGPHLNAERWEEKRPRVAEEHEKAIDDLILEVPELYKQWRAQRREKEEATAKAERDAQIAAMMEERKLKETEAPGTEGPATDDELAALFDAAAAEAREEIQEQPDAPTPGEPSLAEPEKPAVVKANAQPPVADKTAAHLIKEAAKLGVKGVGEAMQGLADIFGAGRIQSFPGGFDEEAYAKAKPHFEAALEAFKAAGQTLKDLFKLLVHTFGEGIKPYALHFAKEKGLSTQGTLKGDDDGELQGDRREGTEGQKPEGVPEPQGESEVEGVPGQPGAGVRPGGDEADEGGDRPGAEGALPGEDAGDRDGEATGAGSPGKSTRGAAKRASRGLTGTNYRITPADEVGQGGWKTRARQNIEAIKIVKALAAGTRLATHEEQQKLVKYVGWGASELANGIFDNYGHYKEGWADLGAELKELLTKEEYKAARASTLNAHYTSPAVIGGIYQALEKFGFKGGRILEPGAGIGHFIGLRPDGLHQSTRYTAVELDPISAAIAKALYPREDVRAQDFADFLMPKGFYDVVVGNPPFANVKIKSDKEYARFNYVLHDYMIVKSLDRLRAGGVMALVTSRYTLDKGGMGARMQIMKQADLIGAVRLPQTAFKENAGTEVVTDVLFFRKRLPGEEKGGEAWNKIVEVETPEGPAHINEYYAAHPEMVLGEHRLVGKMYADKEYTVIPFPGDIDDALRRAVARLPANIYTETTQEKTPEQALDADINPQTAKENAYYLKDGAIHQRRDGVGVPQTKLSAKHAAIIKRFVPLRDAGLKVLAVQMDKVASEADLKSAQKVLGKAYDAFVKAFGPVNKEIVRDYTDIKGVERESVRNPNIEPFKSDPDAYRVASFEIFDRKTGKGTKAAIFTERTISPETRPKIEGPTDALHVTLAETGRVDMKRIAELAGLTEKQAIERLGDAVYQNPEAGAWESAADYLSGPVRQKLKYAEAAALADPRYQRNVEALRAAQPEDQPPSRIDMAFGMPILRTTDIEDFCRDVMGIGVTVKHVPEFAAWSVEGGHHSVRSIAATSEWGTPRYNAVELINAALNKTSVKVHDYVDKKPVLNVEATEAANDKLARIKARFGPWIWEDGARAEHYVRSYNDTYNDSVKRDFGGPHIDYMRFPGVSTKIKPALHQKRVAYRIIQRGNTYMAHEVGTGKTIGSILAGMELKRLGIKKKPCWVVPNHMLKQFATEFLELYPAAKILVADEENFAAEERNRFMGRIAAENWDGIIITHSAFGKIPLSDAYQRGFLEMFIAELEEMLAAAQGDRLKTKQIERAKKRLEQRLAKILSGANRDRGVGFEETGIDQLFIDEAQEFRKIDFVTNMSDIKGIDPAGSAMAFDLYNKSRYLESLHPGRSLVLLSGTPITNTLGEAFSIQRLLQPEALKSRGIDNFDAWAATFGDTVTKLEPDPAGDYRTVTRFAEFRNAGQLSSLFGEVCDAIFARDVPQAPGRERPKVKDGQRRMVLGEMTPLQLAYQGRIKERLKAIKARKGKAEKGDDIILTVITDGQHAAIDQRFIDPQAGADPNSKIELMINKVVELWEEHKDQRLTQMIFNDLGTPGAEEKRGWSSYNYIRKTLIARGIPAKEIAFMRDYKKNDAKKKLFDAMNRGDVRVLIGSSEAMGTGVNAQRLLKALHHLDPDQYLPASMTQREGRIIRQGNLNKEVEIYAYATKGPSDEAMWGTLERKQRFIDEFLQGQATGRTEDMDGGADLFALARALSSRDPRVMELASLEGDLQRLDRLEAAHRDDQVRLRRIIHNNKDSIRLNEQHNKKIREALKEVTDTRGDKFTAEVLGKAYTDRSKAGEALLTYMKADVAKVKKEGLREQPETVGLVAGLRIKARVTRYEGADSTHYVRIQLASSGDVLEGKMNDMSEEDLKEKDPSQLMQGLEAKSRGFESWIGDNEKKIAEYQEENKDAEARLGLPFEKDAELKEKRAKAEELRTALEAEDDHAPVSSDDGEVQYSATSRLGDNERPGGISVEAAEKVVAEFRAALSGAAGVDFRVYGSQEEAFGAGASREAIRARIKGATLPRSRTILLIAGNLRDLREAWAVLSHEVLAHYGLNLFPPEIKKQILERIAASRDMPGMGAFFRKVERDEPDLTGTRQAEEVFGRIIEQGPAWLARPAKGFEQLHKLWNDILALIARGLRKIGLTRGLVTRPELNQLAQSIAQGIRRGAEQRTFPESDAAQFAGDRPEPVFYSEMARFIDDKAPGKAPAAQWKALLDAWAKQGKFKGEELEWSGVKEWLDLPAAVHPPLHEYLDKHVADSTDLIKIHEAVDEWEKLPRIVSKDQVLRFVRENGVRVEETTLAGLSPVEIKELTRLENIAASDETLSDEDRRRWEELDKKQYEDLESPKFAQWQLPGGENYREVLLRLPSTKRALTDAERSEMTSLGLRGKLNPKEKARYDELSRIELAPLTDFRSSHFDQPNILAHVRFNERSDANGKRVLFIEEIQSDWAQKGKREGFGKPAVKPNTAEISRALPWAVGNRLFLTRQDAEEFANAQEAIPSGPFVGKTEAWVGLALKRMIRHAAENGFDRVAWANGEQQAERYDLSKHLDSVSVRKAPSDRGYVVVGKKGNIDVFGSGVVQRDKLADHIGKELASKALADLDAMEKNPAKTEFNNEYQGVLYQGLDLKVGGEGMRAFYDKIVPNVANGLLKKLGGGRVAEADFFGAFGDRAVGDFTAPAFDLTPALRESALGGLPLFSRQDEQRRLQMVRQAMAEIAAGKAEGVARGLRPDLSQYGGDADVHFPWGDPKHGVYHIGTQRGLDVLKRVLRAVALGEQTQYIPAKKTVRITHDETVAILSLDEHGKRKTWLLTGWEEGKPDARGEVSTHTAATQPGPTFSRTALGAGFLDTIATGGGPVKGPQGPLYSRRAEPVTESAAFLRWFGDSKVVDAAGWPKVVYHGTAADFNVFAHDGAATTRHPSRKLGFFFTGSAEEAGQFATLMRTREQGANILPVYLSLQHPAKIDSKAFFEATATEGAAQAYKNRLAAAGHDGIAIKFGDGRMQYVVFSPEQVKSASGNTGTFDPANPDIRYSRATPPDPDTPEGARDAVDRIGNAMRTGRHGWDAIKSKMLKDWRPAWLGIFTRRQLVDIGEAMVPALGNYNRAVEAMDADRNRFDDEAHVVAEAAAAYVKGHKKEADTLFDLMHAATLSGVDPALDYRPSIFRQEAYKEIASLKRRMRTRPGEADLLQLQIDEIRTRLDNEKGRKLAYPSLQKRYAGLSEDAKAVYAQMRDLYSKRFDEREAALIARIKDAEADERWKSRLIADIRRRFETARLTAPYFPLVRFGDYWVAATNPDGEREFHLRESEHQQQALRTELEAGGYRAIEHGFKMDKLFEQQGASAGFVSQIIKVIDSRAGPRSSPALERIKDEIYQIYLHTLPEMSARRHWIHRQKTPGFSQDALRGFAKQMFHGNRQLARLRQESAMEGALSRMRKQANEAPDPNRAAHLVNEMQKRDEWVKNPTTATWANVAGGFGFLWYLTAPASAIVNVTQTPLVAYPLLAARHGWGAAAKALTGATSDYFKGRFSVEGALKGEELAAYRRFLADGLIDKTQSHDLAGMSETPSAIYSGRTAKVMRAASFLFHRAERANREITALAAFRLARAKGLGLNEAYAEAKALTWESHFDYSNANKARFIQGDAARVLFMFKQFSQHMTYLMARSAHQSLKGLDPAARREARVRLSGILGMHALFAGALGMPLMGTLAMVMNALFDDEDEPYDFETGFRNFLAEAFGPEIGQAIARGPVESLTGLGVAHRVGLSDLWFREPDKTLEGRGLVEYWTEQLLGPLGGVALKAGTAYEMFQDGHTARALESMTPTAITSGLRMLRYAGEGARSLRGDPVMEEMSAWNLLGQAAGFSPAELGQEYDANRAIKNLENRILDRRERLINRWWLARRTGDMDGVQEAMAEISRFNESTVIRQNPRARITPATLLASTQARLRYSKRAESGIIVDQRLARLPDQVRFAP